MSRTERRVRDAEGKAAKPPGGSPAAPSAGGQSPGLASRIGGELRAVTPPLALAPVGMSCWLLWGAVLHMRHDDVGGPGWAPSEFSNLGWLCLLSLAALLAAGLRRRLPGTLAAVGVAGHVCFVSALATFAMAWGAERESYWGAFHFVTFFWVAAGSASIALAAAWIGARRGSGVCRALIGTAAASVFFMLVAWLWTWHPWLQGLEGWIGRSLFLATHG